MVIYTPAPCNFSLPSSITFAWTVTTYPLFQTGYSIFLPSPTLFYLSQLESICTRKAMEKHLLTSFIFKPGKVY